MVHIFAVIILKDLNEAVLYLLKHYKND